jgi:cGMP-dependent protein kinase
MGRVASHCVLEEFAKDQKIINKGDHGDKFYIIKSGMVKCKIDDVHPALFLGPKKFFGERALLRDQPRAAHVIAARPTECLSLTRHAFHVLLGPIHADLQKEYSGGGAPAAPVKVKQQAPVRVFAPAEKEEKFNHHNIQLNELTMGPVLGEGTFGRVQLVTHARTSSKWALKIMMKGQIAEMGQTKATMLEKDVMMKIRHPLCLRLEATFMSKNLLYMMLEIVHGGELFQLLADSQTGVVSPNDARFYAACVIDAFSFLHGQGVVYRDLKPENLLIDKAGYLKVIDYGFAKFLTESPYKTFTFCGTPEYFAPEMMAGQGYAHSVDTWGVGILIYEMLYGFTPFADFEDNDPRKTMRYIMKNEVSFPPDGIKNELCENVIRGLLTKNADMRLGCDENGISDVKTHPMYNGFDWNKFYNMQMKSPWVPTLSGPDGVVETTEEYDTYDTYMRNVQKYKGSQKWCQEW